MPVTLKDSLRELVVQRQFNKFFDEWAGAIDRDSALAQAGDQLRSDHADLENNIISGLLRTEELHLRQRQLVNGLLTLVGKIGAADLAGVERKPAAGTPLEALMKRKLAALKEGRLLAVDPSHKFKLDVEIEELERLISEGQ